MLFDFAFTNINVYSGELLYNIRKYTTVDWKYGSDIRKSIQLSEDPASTRKAEIKIEGYPLGFSQCTKNKERAIKAHAQKFK